MLDFSDPSLRFLRDELVTELKQINIQANKKLILLITGLEKSIGILEEYPSVLTNLNFVRDDLRTSTPHPMLLFLPDYALTHLAKYAPDFWAWGRKVFTFKTNRSNLIMNSNNTIFSEHNIDNLNLQNKQARIEQFLNLLNEYNTSTEETTKNDLLMISRIYNELGNAYRSFGQYKKGIISHQKCLDISREIGDRQSEGHSLGNLGNTYQSLEQYQQAIIYHQKCLDISREIGKRQSEGHSLDNLGVAYQSLGQYQKAIDYYKQYLNISREIGDRQGEGMYLCNLGNAYDALGQYKEAIKHYQQALNIFRETGNKRGEAITWSNLGVTFFNIQRHDDAIEAFSNARKLYQDMGLNQKVEDCDDAINILENDV